MHNKKIIIKNRVIKKLLIPENQLEGVVPERTPIVSECVIFEPIERCCPKLNTSIKLACKQLDQ